MDEKNFEMMKAMEIYGGSFVKALARCLACADRINYNRLEAAFPDYFNEYAEIAKKREKIR